MIDVMFFLLVTFMLASLSMQSLQLDRASICRKATRRSLQHQEPVTLTITKDSKIFLDKTPTTLDTTGVRAEADVAGADPGVVVNADSAAPEGIVVQAMIQARRAGRRALSDRGEARMNAAVQTASPFLDEPWRRLVWIAPLSVAIWVGLLLAFALMLKQTAPPLPELKPIEASNRRTAPDRGLAGRRDGRSASSRPGGTEAQAQAAGRGSAQSDCAGASA